MGKTRKNYTEGGNPDLERQVFSLICAFWLESVDVCL